AAAASPELVRVAEQMAAKVCDVRLVLWHVCVGGDWTIANSSRCRGQRPPYGHFAAAVGLGCASVLRRHGSAPVLLDESADAGAADAVCRDGGGCRSGEGDGETEGQRDGESCKLITASVRLNFSRSCGVSGGDGGGRRACSRGYR